MLTHTTTGVSTQRRESSNTLKHYSEVLNEDIWLGESNTLGLVNYTKDEIEHIKSLRRVTKSDTEFEQRMRLIHSIKRSFKATIKDWEIPWETQKPKPKPRAEVRSVSEPASFWMQRQQDYSDAIADKIKSLTSQQKSAQRYKNLLKYQDNHKYKS